MRGDTVALVLARGSWAKECEFLGTASSAPKAGCCRCTDKGIYLLRAARRAAIEFPRITLPDRARGLALSIRETPQAVSVLTSESMSQRQVRDVTTALELVAGLVPSSESAIGGPFAGRGPERSMTLGLHGRPGKDERTTRYRIPH